MKSIQFIDLSTLPEQVQQEVYDFFLFTKQRVENQQVPSKAGDCALLSEKSLAEDWNKVEEDQAWQNLQ